MSTIVCCFVVTFFFLMMMTFREVLRDSDFKALQCLEFYEIPKSATGLRASHASATFGDAGESFWYHGLNPYVISSEQE